MKIKIYSTIIIGALLRYPVFAQTFKLLSPDKKNGVIITNQQHLQYSISNNGLTIVMPSSLGFEFKDEPVLGGDMVVLAAEEHSVNKSWIPIIKTKRDIVHDHYNELKLSLIEKYGLRRRMNLWFRVYDDGIAFRYQLFGGDKVGDRQITKENTCFTLAANSKVWVAEYGGYSSPRGGNSGKKI